MGHAVHFLRRLDRVRDNEVELALTLYRDEELLRAVLDAASLPDGASRLAISLEDPELGPFVVVTRAGKFVTCLGHGMSVGDLPVVSRQRIEVAASRVQRMRERLDRVRQVAESGTAGEAATAFERMQRRGPRFSREDASTLLRMLPILGRDTLLALAGTLDALKQTFRGAQRLQVGRRFSSAEEDFALALCELVWGANNLLVIASPLDLRVHEPALFDELGTAPLMWASSAAVSGMCASQLRGSWVAAQLGKSAVVPIKGRRARPASVATRLFLELALGAIACASTKARAEARKSLGAPWIGSANMTEAFDLFMDQWTKIIEVAIDHPEVADVGALHAGKNLAAAILRNRAPTEAEADEIPADVARAFFTTLSVSVLHEGAGQTVQEIMPLALPWLARAKPEELFMPQAWTDRLVATHRDVASVREWLDPLLRRAARTPIVHTAEALGRNDPCSCGSGAKYKRCCGRPN